MKTLLIVSFLFSHSLFAAGFVCKTPVKKERTVLFLDTNNGKMEIETAKKAACARGDNFKLVTVGNFPKEQLKTELQNLRNQKSKPVSIILSGHDGGGTFSGEIGNISRTQLTSLIEHEFSDFKDSVESLYLLGCYTGVKFEMFSWVGAFPKLKIVAGYEGAAPLNIRVAGHDYLRDLMVKEGNLSAAKSSLVLKLMLENIKGMSQLKSAVLVKDLYCSEENKDYYYRAKPESGQNFAAFNMKDCPDRIKKIQNTMADFNAYYSGEKEIPSDTANGPVRAIYELIRGSEHCFEGATNSFPKGDQVLALLFYKGYSQHFADWAKKDSEEIQKLLNELTMADWSKSVDLDILEVEAETKKLESIKADLVNFEKTKAQYKKDFQAFGDQITALTASDPRLRSFIEGEDDFPTELPESFSLNLRNQWQQVVALSKKISVINYDVPKDDFTADLESNIANSKDVANELRMRRTSKEDFENAKKLIWLPTKDKISSLSRRDLLASIHTMKGFADVNLLPRNIRQKYRALTNNTILMLNNLKAMPLSWHAYPAEGTVGAPLRRYTAESTSPAYIFSSITNKTFEDGGTEND